jgi:hypothetical protein
VTDDELAIELVAEDRRPSRIRRWPLLALLAIVVAVVILVGQLDSHERQTSMPTTTSTLATTTTRHPTTTDTYVTTTTSLPRFEPGEGALLPEADGTYLLTTEDNLLVVTDLSTGGRCVNSAGDGPWIPFRTTATRQRVVIGTRTGIGTIDARCKLQHLGSGADGDPVGGPNSHPVADGAGGVWVAAPMGNQLAELDDDGVGRIISVPMNSGMTVVEVGGRVAIGLSGSITLVDPATGGTRDLGPGIPSAASGNTLAYTSCPRLRCVLVLLDVRTGARRTIDDEDIAATTSGTAVFSRDGRYLGLTTVYGKGAVVDLRTGDVTRLEAPPVVGFTANSAWALLSDGSRIWGIRLDGTDLRPIRPATSAITPNNGVSVLISPVDY